MSFAEAEATVNSAVMAALSNARGDFGGDDFPIIFDNGCADMGIGVSARQPTAVVEDDQLAQLEVNVTQLRVDGVTSYTVRGSAPDGTGLSLLDLEAC